MRLALVLLLCSNTALAAGNWARFDVPGGYWEYDKASITPTADGKRRILGRFTLHGFQKDSATGAHWDHAVYVIETDCENNRYRVADVVGYFRAERAEMGRTSSDWRPSPPVVHKAACG